MPIPQRIVSFLPSATEMLCALGLGERLVGITHECDYPVEVKGKPIVVRNVLPIESMTESEIDKAVAARMREGLSLYQIDEKLLRDLDPDLILTQDLCQVCAPSGNEVSQVLQALPHKPEILWLTPKSIAEIFENVRDLGRATGSAARAEQLVHECQRRLEKLKATADKLATRPRVFCMEWIDPIYASGHWVPEMVGFAGGVDQIGREGTDSVRVPWDELVKWAPEVLIIMPCGFNLTQVVEQAFQSLPLRRPDVRPPTDHTDKPQSAASNPRSLPGWDELPAVRNNRVYAVDANSYFARPGPRVVEGAELLAHLIHPQVFSWSGPANAFHHF